MLRIIDTGCISKVELAELADILDVCQERRVVKVNFEVLRLTEVAKLYEQQVGMENGICAVEEQGFILRCITFKMSIRHPSRNTE